MCTKPSSRLAIALVLLATAACSGPEAPADEAPSAETAVRRIVARLDYVAADYGGAVRDGEIVNELEYDEQVGFLTDARGRLAALPSGSGSAKLQQELDHAASLVAKKSSREEVEAACVRVRQELLRLTGVTLAPSTPPSSSDGATLFGNKCAHCHGTSGAGDGPSGRKLSPPPRSFQDPAVMARLSPVRAYSAITDGIAGTAMARLPELDEADRWSLAFYVVSLRHDESAGERGKAIVSALPPTSLGLPALANATDAELMASLTRLGIDPGSRGDALAYLRTEAPYRGLPSLAPALTALAEVRDRYEHGAHAAAADIASDAYLNGFEPFEGQLAVSSADLVHRIEERFLALRQSIEQGAPPATIGQAVDELGILLEAADARLGDEASGWSTALTVFVIIVREGIESVLLLMLLLGLAARAGAPGDRRAVHQGWGVALLAGVVTWFASAAVVNLGGGNRELVEGIIALFAVVVLVYSGHFVLARLDAQRRITSLKRRFGALSPERRRLLLAGLAFLAVYREAFEVVLFLRAVVIASPGSTGAFLAGLVAGIAGCVSFAVVAVRLGRRLKPSAILTIGGALLCVLAIVLAGKGVRALQEAGVVGISTVSIPRVDALGVFPTWQTLGAQALVLALLGVITFLAFRRKPEPEPVIKADPPSQTRAAAP
ncbi:MAG: FTR1 family protein [Deltaproteobacteria bacterium]|nr:FTR1 family protein [Deltaproteobacteria bacterium]